MKKTNATPLGGKSRPIERFSYGIYFLGQGLIFTLVSQYLMMYYTDYIYLAPLAMTAITVGGKIWDAINDVLFGMIVDKVKFKSGNKFLPWIRISTFLIPASTVLLFIIKPDWPMWVRIVMAIVTYLIWDTAYTVCDAPIYALNTAMTSDVKERGTNMTFSGMGGAIAVALTTLAIVPVFNRKGFLTAGILVAVIGFVAMSFITFFGKERFHATNIQQQEAPLKETWDYLKHNKYLKIFYAYRIISGCITVSMLSYLAKYCLGDVEAVGTVTIYSIPIIAVLYLVSPFLLKRFNKIAIYRVCIISHIIVGIATWLIGYQNKTIVLWLCAVILALAILPGLCNGVIPADCVEYGTFKTGIRKEGITFSIQTFANKLTAAVATGMSGLVLHFLNYDPKLEVIPESVVQGIWNANFLIPVIGQLIALVFLFKYNLKDADVQLMTDVNSGKITRAEAEMQFTHPY